MEATPEGQLLPNLPAAALRMLRWSPAGQRRWTFTTSACYSQRKAMTMFWPKVKSCFFPLNHITQFERQFGVYKQFKSSGKRHTCCQVSTSLQEPIRFFRDNGSPPVDHTSAGLSASSRAVCSVQQPPTDTFVSTQEYLSNLYDFSVNLTAGLGPHNCELLSRPWEGEWKKPNRKLNIQHRASAIHLLTSSH